MIIGYIVVPFEVYGMHMSCYDIGKRDLIFIQITVEYMHKRRYEVIWIINRINFDVNTVFFLSREYNPSKKLKVQIGLLLYQSCVFGSSPFHFYIILHIKLVCNDLKVFNIPSLCKKFMIYGVLTSTAVSFPSRWTFTNITSTSVSTNTAIFTGIILFTNMSLKFKDGKCIKMIQIFSSPLYVIKTNHEIVKTFLTIFKGKYITYIIFFRKLCTVLICF